MSSAAPPIQPHEPQDAPSGAVALHSTEFQRNLSTGLWRALCTCGWERVGAQMDVRGRASFHDLDADGAA